MRRFFRIIAVLALSAAGIFSCKSQYDVIMESSDVDAKYAAAMDYFNRGKYQKAAQLFESMSFLTTGTERDDTVQYYWGLSNYRFKDYYTAESNFAKFLESFPRSVFAEEAMFYRLDCLYRASDRYELDQTGTRTCLAAIDRFEKEHPGESAYTPALEAMKKDLNGRLDRKAYENALLYYKMEYYKSSQVALRNVLKDNSENIYREDILYYIAMSSYNYAKMSVPAKQKERYLVFIDDYLNFIGEFPDSRYRHELDVLYRRVRKETGQDGGAAAADVENN